VWWFGSAVVVVVCVCVCVCVCVRERERERERESAREKERARERERTKDVVIHFPLSSVVSVHPLAKQEKQSGGNKSTPNCGQKRNR